MWFAARGWQHTAWDGSFYPEDLPEVWRFGYYSNEFSSVVLPFEDLTAADLDEVEQWLEDCDEAFRFLVEVGGAVDGLQGEKLALLKPQIGAVIFPQIATGQLELLAIQDILSDVPCYVSTNCHEELVWSPTPLHVQTINGSGETSVVGQLLYLGSHKIGLV